jgi:rubrerythrin
LCSRGVDKAAIKNIFSNLRDDEANHANTVNKVLELIDQKYPQNID